MNDGNRGRVTILITIIGMDIPDMFLLAESILLGLDNITDGLVVYPKRIQSRVLEELPFMITESVSFGVKMSRPYYSFIDDLEHALE